MYIIRIIDAILSDKRLQKTHVAAPVAATISRQGKVAGEVAAGRSAVERRRVGVALSDEANWRLFSGVLDAGKASGVHVLVAITGDGERDVVAKERHLGTG
jgi:hypothetical protein